MKERKKESRKEGRQENNSGKKLYKHTEYLTQSTNDILLVTSCLHRSQ